MTHKEFDEFMAHSETDAEIKHFSEIMNTGELGIEAMKYMGALVQRNRNYMDEIKKAGKENEEILELVDLSSKSIRIMTDATHLLKLALVGLILVDIHCTGGDEK